MCVSNDTEEEIEVTDQLSEKDLSAKIEDEQAVRAERFWRELESNWMESGPEWLTDPLSDEQFSYDFTEENPSLDAADPLAEGKRCLEQGELGFFSFYLRKVIQQYIRMSSDAGDIPKAILLFESACRQKPDCAEAWSLLGTSQAKNENDPGAIAALVRAVKLLESSSSSEASLRDVLMALAASYANESYHALACEALQGKIE